MIKLLHHVSSITAIVAIIFTNSIGYAREPFSPNAAPICGEWKIEIAGLGDDQRIGVTLSRQSAGDDCYALFTLKNKTGTQLGGGYSLIISTSSSNANAQFLPAGDPILIPGLDIEVKTVPIDISKQASVTLKGEVTPGSILALDLSIFLMKTAIDLMPVPTGCLISYDQIFLIALRTTPILESAARLALQGDLIGSKEELSRVITAFYEKAGEYARDVGIGCFADYLKSLIGKPIVIAKIVFSYITWIPVVIFDYFKYQGMYALVKVSYSPPYPSVNFPFYDGSYYELVYVNPPLNWDKAKSLANSKTMGWCHSAHLATVTSKEEQAIVTSLMKTANGNGWLGGFQPSSEKSLAVGWKWITDESFVYTNWEGPRSYNPPGEPNDTPSGTYIAGSEQYLEIYGGSGYWNDAPLSDQKNYYIVEYEDCD